MNSSKKKNRNEDSSDEEYVVSEFSYISTSSSNDHGNATVSIGDAQRMRESFRTHFNAVAFGFFNENAGSGTTPVNAETGATTATKNEKACTGTTPVDHAETGTTGAIRNEKATVAGKAPKAETRTTTATWAAKRIENAKSRTKKKTARIIAGTKEKNTPGTGKAGSCDITDEKYNEIAYNTTGTGKTRSCDMTDEKYNEVVYIIEKIQRQH